MNLFGKTDNNPTKPAAAGEGFLFLKPTEEKSQETKAPNTNISSGLSGMGLQAPKAQSNEEKKETAQSASTPLFGGAASNPSNNSVFGSTNLASGNLFGNSSGFSNANKTSEAESKPANSGLFGTKTALNPVMNSSSGLFGESKPPVQNDQELKEAYKGNVTEEKKNQTVKEPMAAASSGLLFGNLNKSNEPNADNKTNLFGAAANAATSTDADAKSNLFGASSKGPPSAEAKSNLFGASGVNSISTGLFAGNKPAESNQYQSSAGGASLFASQPKALQTGLSQGLFGSVANKLEEKSDVQKDSQPAKPFIDSCKAILI